MFPGEMPLQSRERPQADADALVWLRVERLKLGRIVESLRAQDGAAHAWKVEAWRRVLDRAITYAINERDTLGQVHTETRWLLQDIELELRQLEKSSSTGADPRRAWRLMETTCDAWDLHTVQEAAPRFEQALDARCPGFGSV